MTGKTPARLRITNHMPDQPRFTPDDPVLLPAECADRLPLEEVTLAELLRDAGFANAWNVRGGILAWIDRIDPSLTRY